jgi:hypothetical protein
MQLTTGLSRPAVLEVDKGQGRLERREFWAVPSGELCPYLEQESDWSAMAWWGRIHRQRRPSNRSAATNVEEHTWVFGSRRVEALTERTERWLRGHRTIENGVFRVFYVSYDEDRLRARKTGTALSEVHQAAINLIRGHGYPYVPTVGAGSLPELTMTWLSLRALHCWGSEEPRVSGSGSSPVVRQALDSFPDL